ncbi:MAG: 1-acyl-sn-glycerol-3-phosphate acyltransferase [Salinivirgaceae bacterium]|jgi:1-acyl-sn-glycerol-3-phosphate acyltransferase|nr:1-acyl-sn-glycerol-3-phosphate acyltransferase [Salinivirgaceae bacterium]
MEQNQNIKLFDVKKILHEKSPKLSKWIPGFVIKFLKKVVCEDFINVLIRDYGHLEGFDFSEGMITRFNLSLKIVGEKNLPTTGKYIFVSNHPLGGLDGHILMYLIGQRYGSYKFLVNDILMGLKNMKNVFIPVNKHGRQGVEFAKQIDKAYESDVQMLTFPAGMVSRKIKGQIIDLPWQKNFIAKAVQHKRDIVPIHLTGRNTDFFYRLGNIRKRLGIKGNIEMLYLIEESIKQENNKFVVTFGKPIPWQTFDTTKRPAEWAKWVKGIVYKMGGVEHIPF